MSGGSGKRAADARRIDEGQRADALVAGTSAPAPASPKPKRIKSSKMSLTRSFARVLPRSGDEEGSRTPATELLRRPPDESQALTGVGDRMDTDEQQKEGAGASEDPVTPRDVRKTALLCARARALGALRDALCPCVPCGLGDYRQPAASRPCTTVRGPCGAPQLAGVLLPAPRSRQPPVPASCALMVTFLWHLRPARVRAYCRAQRGAALPLQCIVAKWESGA